MLIPPSFVSSHLIIAAGWTYAGKIATAAPRPAAQDRRCEKATYLPVIFLLVGTSGPYFTVRKYISGGSNGGVWGPSAHYNLSYRYLKSGEKTSFFSFHLIIAVGWTYAGKIAKIAGVKKLLIRL